MLCDIMRKLPLSGNVLIEVDSKHLTVIKCQKTEFKILGQSGVEFPFLPAVDRVNGYYLPCADLRDMIRFTVFSAAVDESKPIMTGEMVEADDKEFRIVATDGFRMALRRKKTERTDNDTDEDTEAEGTGGVNIKAVIPSKAMNEVARLLPQGDDETVGLYITENHALFKMKGCVIVTRLLYGDYINYARIYAQENTTAARVARADLLGSVERALLMSRDVRKSPVKLKLAGEKIEVTSFTEVGNFYDEIDAEIDGAEIELLFNPRYVVDVLKVIDEDSVSLEITTPLSPCFFRSVDKSNDSYDYLVLPLRSMR
jgi:DNA polymerase-3 subunit beta